MKSKIKFPSKKEFPKLMQLKDDEKIVVVLFSDANTGTIVFSKNTLESDRVGNICLSYDISQFKEFKGKITLSN